MTKRNVKKAGIGVPRCLLWEHPRAVCLDFARPSPGAVEPLPAA